MDTFRAKASKPTHTDSAPSLISAIATMVRKVRVTNGTGFLSEMELKRQKKKPASKMEAGIGE